METRLIIAFIILTIILWVWDIIDITKSRFKNQTTNTVWLLAVLFFPVLGSIVYFQLRKKYVTKESRRFQEDFNQISTERN